ncbi:MAG: GNAT family N-acetyltransferase [Anaerolineae bacterium]|nr:GNAT family N-acetyltransferase [Anaerolineae bacterium]
MNTITSRRALIQRLELLSAQAMPALLSRFYDGWYLRFSSGYTRRANAIQPLYPSSLPCDEKVTRCEELYQRLHQPAIFKLTETSQPADLEPRLVDRGYAISPATYVQTLALGGAAPGPVCAGSSTLSDAWLNAYLRLNHVPEAHRATLHAMLQKIAGDTWYALLRDEASGSPVAVGLGVLSQEWLGIFDVVVATGQRQQTARTAPRCACMPAWAFGSCIATGTGRSKAAG